MRMMTPNRRYPPGRASLASVSLVLVPALWACGEMATATRVTSPLEQFGHEIGADYVLPNYVQLTEYWELLASESDRMTLESIGRTEEGREQLMATITSPGNHRNLARYKDIAERMAHAEGVSEAEARAMAAEGRAVVWIDGGLHANEVLGAQQLMELVYHLVSSTADETMRILDDVVVLVAHANPDGHDLLANWYMRIETPEERSTGGVPVLYQKYAGHDNNRDFYMSALAETTNVNRIIAREWFPQIVYNHHQTGPLGTVMFAPPFRDPPNHYLDPLILTGLDQVGSAMHQRFVLEGKGGTTMRSGASYSTWWNGGLRTTPYFKNQIGLLTETIGNPTPIAIPFLPRRQLPHGDLPLPVEPGVWHFRQSVDYSMTANLAVLDFASRNKDHLLFNIWRMGTNSIERGSRDHWTVLPFEIDEASETIARMGSRDDYERLLRDPRRPRSARLHPALRPAGLPDGHQVRERAAEGRSAGASGDRRFRGRRHELSRRVLGGAGRAGVPAPRPRHVRAAEPPQRLPLSGRAPDGSVRQRRVDPGLSDGRRVRPHSGRLRRPLRAHRVAGRDARGHGRGSGRCRRLPRQPRRQRRLRGRQPRARGGRERPLDEG